MKGIIELSGSDYAALETAYTEEQLQLSSTIPMERYRRILSRIFQQLHNTSKELSHLHNIADEAKILQNEELTEEQAGSSLDRLVLNLEELERARGQSKSQVLRS